MQTNSAERPSPHATLSLHTLHTGEWRPLGDRDSTGWEASAAAIRHAAHLPGAAASGDSAVRSVAGNIAGGITGGAPSHETRPATPAVAVSQPAP